MYQKVIATVVADQIGSSSASYVLLRAYFNNNAAYYDKHVMGSNVNETINYTEALSETTLSSVTTVSLVSNKSNYMHNFEFNMYWVDVKPLEYKKLKATDLYNIGSKKSFVLFGNVNWVWRDGN